MAGAPDQGSTDVSGFGLALPTLVDHGIPKHPWLTIELIQQEQQIWNYGADPVAVFQDSLLDAADVAYDMGHE